MHGPGCQGIFLVAAALLAALPSAAAFVAPVRLPPCLRHAPVSASLREHGATSLRAPLEGPRPTEAGGRSSAFAGARGTPRTVLHAGIGDTIKGWFGGGPPDPEKVFADKPTLLEAIDTLHETTGEFGIFTDALNATGVSLMLRDAGPLTLVAVPDSAFKRLPEDCLLADCLVDLRNPLAERSEALLAELRTTLYGCIAPGRQTIDEGIRGKSTVLETLSGRKMLLDLLLSTSPNDFSDYVLDASIGQKVKVRSAGILVSRDLQCKNGVIHVSDRLPDGVIPIILPSNAPPAAPLPAEDDSKALGAMARRGMELRDSLAAARARLEVLEQEAEPLVEMVAEKLLNRASAKELAATYERLDADLTSLKARAEGDMKDSAGQATVGVTKAFLPLLDNLERAAGAYTCQTEGEKRVMDEYKKEEQEFLEVLRSNGIDMVESLGQVFDPRVHEGVTMRESEEYEDGVVCTQLQRGYKMGDRLVRPALVAISSGPGPSAAPPATSAPEAATFEAPETSPEAGLPTSAPEAATSDAETAQEASPEAGLPGPEAGLEAPATSSEAATLDAQEASPEAGPSAPEAGTSGSEASTLEADVPKKWTPPKRGRG